jgi:hypothetical protein
MQSDNLDTTINEKETQAMIERAAEFEPTIKVGPPGPDKPCGRCGICRWPRAYGGLALYCTTPIFMRTRPFSIGTHPF